MKQKVEVVEVQSERVEPVERVVFIKKNERTAVFGSNEFLVPISSVSRTLDSLSCKPDMLLNTRKMLSNYR